MSNRRKAPVVTASKPRAARPSVPAPPKPASDPYEAAGAEAAYEIHLAAALALDPREVTVWNASATVALHNARVGVAAVLAEKDALAADPDAPRVDVARIERVPSIAEALVFATRRVANVVEAAGEAKPLVARAYELRELLLTSAVALSHAKALDAKAVALIQRGTGPLDCAQDCIDLAALFRANTDRIGGRTAVTADDLREAAALGTKLLATLKPEGIAADGSRGQKAAEAASVRDRMGSLLAREYGYVAKIGGYRWGHALAEHVPPLRSRSVTQSGAAQEPPSPT